jgi:peptidoglycan LD-endopeptidase CwlK
MVLMAIGGYFLMACLLAALVLLPKFRHHLLSFIAMRCTRWLGAGRAQGRQLDEKLRGYSADTSANAQGVWRWMARHRKAVACALGLLLLPPIVAIWLSVRQPSDSTDDVLETMPDAVVSALLQGEQLVPPLPLPPEAFTTVEVMSIRPEVVHADRRWGQLDAQFQQRLLLTYKLMREEHGYEMVLLEGYRSPDRQNELAKLGSHVTNAKAWQSYHQYGLAADSAFLRQGKVVISERDPWAMRGYTLYGQVAERVGLRWGGRWQNADLGHIESKQPLPQRPRSPSNG